MHLVTGVVGLRERPPFHSGPSMVSCFKLYCVGLYGIYKCEVHIVISLFCQVANYTFFIFLICQIAKSSWCALESILESILMGWSSIQWKVMKSWGERNSFQKYLFHPWNVVYSKFYFLHRKPSKFHGCTCIKYHGLSVWMGGRWKFMHEIRVA